MQAKFICIGFQKCGTTTLYDILRQHRGIALTQDVKEPMFYRAKGLRELLGKKWYEKRYFGKMQADDPRLPGEVNAGLGTDGCAAKIGKDFPKDTKLIFMMREPVGRSFSAYKYFLARGFLPYYITVYDKLFGHEKGFHKYVTDCLNCEKTRANIMKKRLKYLVFSQSMYATCIKEYMNYFPKENIKFIIFEEFIRNQKKACQEIYEFLEVEDDSEVDYQVVSNEGNLAAFTPVLSKIDIAFTGTHYFLYEFLNIGKYSMKLQEAYETIYHAVERFCLRPDKDKSGINKVTKKILESYYQKEILEVEKIIGRSLKGIWY